MLDPATDTRTNAAREPATTPWTHAVDHAWLRVPALPASARRAPGGTVSALRRWLSYPDVREAMWIASPSLASEIDGYLDQPATARARRTELALVRYLSRMSSRATPFGGFAAVGTLELASTTRIVIGRRTDARRLTRIDGAILGEFTAALARDPAIRPRLRHRVNSTAYRVADQLRYAEQRFLARFVSYRLASVDADDVLLDLLELGRHGLTPSELTDRLAALHSEFPRDDVREFVEAAIDEQVLLPELMPSPTCDDALADVLSTLRAVGGTRAETVSAVLTGVVADMERLDAAGFGSGVAPYLGIQHALEGAGLVADAKSWWQVDAARGMLHAQLGAPILREVERLVALLHRLASPEPQESLDDFKRRFEARYGEREMPLGEVLDEESGIGYGPSGSSRDVAPLLVGLPPVVGSAPARSFTRRDTHLMGRLLALAPGAELVLDESDLAALTYAGTPPALPASLAVMAEVAASSADAIDRGEFLLHLDNASGPSSARILGRFGHVCPSLAEQGRRHAAAEAALQPHAVLAEIVYLPEGRANNVVMRTRYRAHELALLARPSVDDEHCHTLDDLRVSVRGGRVVLRSQKLGREIIPRLSCTHNYHGRSLGVYTFLCALQGQDTPSLWFDWGVVRAAERLPRVRYGRLVLARARWNLGPQAVASIAVARHGAKQASTPEELDDLRARTFAAVTALREQHGLPRYVMLVDLDNTLPVDLDDEAEVEAFAAIVKGRSSIVLEEPACSDDELFVEGPDGRYHAQLVLSLLRKVPAPALEGAPMPPRTSVGNWSRYHPGSRWAYIKLYAGPSACDDLLHGVLAPWLQAARGDGRIARWFFLRYADPDVHLRLRLDADPGALAREILPSLWNALQPWTTAGTVWRVVQDTYDPEAHRYGGTDAISAVEDAFAADSDAALAALGRLHDDEDARWSVTLLGLAGILGAFAGPDDDATAWVRSLRDEFVGERGGTPSLREFLATQWRRRKHRVTAILSTPPEQFEEAAEIFRRRDATLRSVADHLRRLEVRGGLTRPIPAIVGSLMHMHVNRMLRADHRAQETLLYDLLLRARESSRARRAGRP